MANLGGADAIRDVVEPVVSGDGLYLEDIKVQKRGNTTVVQVIVDLPEEQIGSVDSDALADVSRSVSKALDRANPVPGAYTLEVTSPGTSRPLTETRHFKRARGRLVRLKLADGTKVTGRIIDVDNAVHLDTGDETITIELGDIAKGVVEVEMSRIMELGAETDGDQTSEPTQEEA